MRFGTAKMFGILNCTFFVTKCRKFLQKTSAESGITNINSRIDIYQRENLLNLFQN